MSPFKIFSASKFSDFLIKAIGEHLLREEDKRELLATIAQQTPGEALLESVRSCPDTAWVCFDHSMETIAVFGYKRLKGIPKGVNGVAIWMVATPHIYNHIKPFLKVSKKIINYWCEKFGVIHNYIDMRNEAHIRWLEHMEFTFSNTVEIDGKSFRYFYKEKDNV